MMAEKVYGFSEDGFKKVRESTRRVLGTSRKGSQRRRQNPVVGTLPFRGQANANIAGFASGSVSVYNGQPGAETDSLQDVTAVNLTDTQADSGTWVLIFRMNGGLGFLPMECPA